MIKLEMLSATAIDCKICCKMFTHTKLKDVVCNLLLYLINFQKDILQTKKVILQDLINIKIRMDHVTSVIAIRLCKIIRKVITFVSYY